MAERKDITGEFDSGDSKVSSRDVSIKGAMDEKTTQVDSTVDVEVGATDFIETCDDAGYHRSLKRRQVMMMTFGAGIGTGLWVGTGQALAHAGPAGTAIAYTISA